MVELSYIALAGAGTSIAASYYIYRRMQQNLDQVYRELDELEENVNDLEVNDRVYNQDQWDEEDLLEENIKKLAEKLSELLRTKHDLGDATTYNEMVEKIEELDVGDPDMKEKVLRFYRKVIKIEYSDEKLDPSEKEELKRNAVDLIKRTGQSLEEKDQDTEEE
ncbi:MAG: hypothetical protein V5A72_01520 [Candidatus Nanohaloarchaea archaeon]